MKVEKKSQESTLVVGVLSLQGDFLKHCEVLRNLGVIVREVRKPTDLDFCDALIIPGGESTAILKQVLFIDFQNSLNAFAKVKPVFGTCAGLILMSQEITGYAMSPFKWLGIETERNAFGRQSESFESMVDIHLEKQKPKSIPAIFIRAPRILKCNPGVKVLATWREEPVLVQEGHHLGSTFHPELTSDTTVHEYFLDLARKSKRRH